MSLIQLLTYLMIWLVAIMVLGTCTQASNQGSSSHTHGFDSIDRADHLKLKGLQADA